MKRLFTNLTLCVLCLFEFELFGASHCAYSEHILIFVYLYAIAIRRIYIRQTQLVALIKITFRLLLSTIFAAEIHNNIQVSILHDLYFEQR